MLFCRLLLLVAGSGLCCGVRFAYLGVPGSVAKGAAVWLDCGFDLQGDQLYSVKWYKDNVEFYRFLPGDKPSGQMYNLDGVFLDLRHSNSTHAFLYKTELETEGTYGCEVSTEVPSFRTIKAEKELRVHIIPDDSPRINDVMNRYGIGDEVNVSCIFGPSKPSADLIWYINGEEAPASYVHHQNSDSESNDLKMSESRLVFVLDPHHLWQRSLSLRCVASLSQVHSKSSQELIVSYGASSGAEFQHVPYVLPGEGRPSITGSLPRYYVGDLLDVNCTSERTSTLPQLQWYVNDEEVKPKFLTEYEPTSYLDGLSSARLGLKFRVLEEHFKDEEMRLKCTATLSKMIRMTSTETILGENHRSSGFHILDNSQAGLQHGGAIPQILLASLLCYITLVLS